MRLTIDHRTEYRTSEATSYSVQYVRLTPRDDPGQHTVRWRVNVPGNVTCWRDAFGNWVHCVTQDGDHTGLTLSVNGEVDTEETHGIIPVRDTDLAPECFLRSTELTAVDDRIRDFIAALSPLRDKGDLTALHALMATIHDQIAYVPGETDTQSTAIQVLTRQSGVCQDHAHLFIACCHAWGIPARYVSGYLHTSAEDGRHLSTHAWAEALVDYLGWVSFDPCNRQSATPAYVRLAVAQDYQGAAPVRGIRLGGDREDMQVRVRIQARSAQQ